MTGRRPMSPESVRIVTDAIERAEQLAHSAGLLITAHALNNAKNATGWEAAGNWKKAEKAAKGDRT